jgi:hypothetical protein
MLFPKYSAARLKKLRRDRDRLMAVWEEKRRAMVNPNKDQSDEFWHARRSEIDPIREEIEQQLSLQLVAQAQRYDVPVPEFVDDNGGPWREPEYSAHYFLNEAARAELRSAIRKEQRERSEILRTWLTVVLSVIGAVTGIAALLFRK